MKHLFFYFLAIITLACRRDPNPPNPPTLTDSVTIYVSGAENIANGNRVLKSWKNGVSTILSDSSSNHNFCSGMFVSGNDLYVVGNEFYSNWVARYWKNGKETILTGVSPNEYTGDIFVSGTNVYISGSEGQKAKYWKNNVSVDLSDSSSYSEANTIYVSGSDVYIGGGRTVGQGIYQVPTYWKNGVATTLPVLNSNLLTSNLWGIFVSGTDVYMVGVLGTQPYPLAAYWKNDKLVELTDSTQNSEAFEVFVSGNDVYIAGHIGNRAVYWKNAQAVYLTDGVEYAVGGSIAVLDDVVYVAGYEGNTAKYWKNGIPVSLTDGKYKAEADNIIVTKP